MAVYTNQPTAPIMYLRPTGASFDVPGSGLDGGVNGLGIDKHSHQRRRHGHLHIRPLRSAGR